MAEVGSHKGGRSRPSDCLGLLSSPALFGFHQLRGISFQGVMTTLQVKNPEKGQKEAQGHLFPLPAEAWAHCWVEGGRGRLSKREGLVTASHPQQGWLCPRPGKAEARSQGPPLGLPHEGRGPSTWAIPCWFPRPLAGS